MGCRDLAKPSQYVADDIVMSAQCHYIEGYVQHRNHQPLAQEINAFLYSYCGEGQR